MKIKLKNIGGIRDEEVNLKEGVNVIKAPNATGKTSFTHGLKIVSLGRNEIFTNTQFLNDQSSEGRVTIDGNATVTIARLGGDKLDVTGKPIFDVNGKSDIVFANPENEFLNTIMRGESIEGFINKFSDAKYYKKVNEQVEDIYDNVKSRERDQEKELNRCKNDIMDNRIKTKLENDRQKLKEDKKKLEERELKIIKEKGKDEEKRQREYSDKVDNLRSKKMILDDENNKFKKMIPELEKESKSLEKDVKDLDNAYSKINEKYGDYEAKVKEVKEKIEDKTEILDKITNEIKFDEESLKENKINMSSVKCGECGKDYSSKEREKRVQALNERIRENRAKKNSLNTEVTNLKEEEEYLTRDLKNKIRTMKAELQTKQNKIKDNKVNVEKYSEKIKDNKVSIDKLEKQIVEVEKLMDSTITDLKRKIENIDQEVINIDRTLDRQQGALKEYEITEKKYKIVKNKTKFLEELKASIKETIINLQKTVINNFNESIIKVYGKLNFKDFTGITIDPYTYKIKINRKGLKDNQDLNRLSTSERVTLGVVVMIVGKENYLPDYPFFVLDEVVTSYDPERFKKIIDYIKDKTPYTIVTAFSPTGDKIKVEHSL